MVKYWEMLKAWSSATRRAASERNNRADTQRALPRVNSCAGKNERQSSPKILTT